ncbi:DUF3320 domain-containing protein [Paraburkholderia sp. 2C]
MAETIANKLEKSRQTLLDLSTRNRLLSLPKRASSKLINIYDELTPEVYRLLVAEGRNMTFLPGKASERSGEDGTAESEPGDDESGVSLPQPADDPDDEAGVASRHRDLRLQTKLASDKLQHRLLEMYYDARTFIEEQGVNILYLALGQLKWFDVNSPETERYAPLILLPVSLERKSAAERFHLQWLQEDAAENLSLAAKLKADFGLILPEFQTGDDFDPVAYLDRVASVISSQSAWEVRPNAMALGFFSFAKFLMYRDLDPANWPAHKRIDEHELIVAAMHEGFPATGELFPEDTVVDDVVSVAEQKHVVDADSSQSLAIEAVRRGGHLVIQGPPGTGKSQTITNVIASAIADGKRVLFVSEKMAALEVVFRRLTAIGLSPACLELHSHHANKRRVLEEIKATRDLGRPKIASRDEIISELESIRRRLNGYAAAMHASFGECRRTPFQIVGQLVRLADVSLSGLPVLLDSPESWAEDTYRARKALVHDFVIKAAKLGGVGGHAWRGVGLTSLLRLDAERLIGQVQLRQKDVSLLLADSAAFATSLGLPLAKTMGELIEQLELSRQIGAAPTLDRATVASGIWASGLTALEQLVQHGKQFDASHAKLQSTFAESAWKEDVESCRRHIAAHGDSIFRVFSGAYRHAMSKVKSHTKAPLPKSYRDRVALLDDIIQSQEHRKAIADRDRDGQAAFGSLWKGEASDWQQLAAVVKWMSGQDGKGLSEAFRTLYSSLPSPEQCAELGTALSGKLKALEGSLTALFSAYALDLPVAFGVSDLTAVTFDGLQNRLQSWAASPEVLFDWVQYVAVRTKAQTEGLAELAAQFELGVIELDRFERFFERAYYEQMLRALSQHDSTVATFDGDLHSESVEAFRSLDKRRIELARAETALAHYEKIPRGNSGIGPMGALNGEIARKRGHMPLRRLFKLAGAAVQTIKPVFMMSPLSVAQFLEPGAVEFDLLVVDEASQIEPVDALGAIARCRQLVVVGDDRQLPPTRFFSRMTSDVETSEDEESYLANAADVESILSLCIAKGMPQMMLRWHYRSRHQSLIAVSNQEFYKNQLFIVPSPHTSSSGMGLRFNHIANGTFDSGGARVNREEARAIARAVIGHAKTAPQMSLGVAAFSLQQKIAIQDELELLRRQHPEVEPFFTGHPDEPFFIKNLENVQGDERDVIFISVAYARSTAGDSRAPLPMRFGPVSLDGGERRLNVLISRAKLRCEVFSSITADDIDLERAKGKGVAALKVFLGYAATGRLTLATQSGRDLDSVFEEEVLQALSAEGLTVHPQVGIAGFFIDLGIVDADNPGRYLLGVECDGASYHASRSARDRDRLRQSVLEDHGWILHRIWSTDWFRQPKIELEKVKTAVIAAKAELESRKDMERSKPGAMQIIVDREDASLLQIDSTRRATIPYQEAAVDVPNHQELHEVPITRLAELMRQVVDVEGPIHFDEVVTRIRTLWGLQRAGNRIREVLDRARQVLVTDLAATTDNHFLDIPGRPIRVRDRTQVGSATLRKPEYLPPLEIREAIGSVLRENLGGHRDEVPSAVGRLLGFGTVSAQLREAVLLQLDSLQRDGAVLMSGNIYRMSSPS